jgi:hypothetical protein
LEEWRREYGPFVRTGKMHSRLRFPHQVLCAVVLTWALRA